MAVHVFVGPTLPAAVVRTARPDAVVYPPVRHGDLLRLALGEGDTVVLIDGYYHQAGAVRHKEILALLAAGVRVVGCASMGALRAAELYPFGMIGYGVVFEQYRDGVLDSDDEVAVMHGEEPDYRQFSIARVAVRHAIAAAQEAGILTISAGEAVLARAQMLSYPACSWGALAASPTTAEACTVLRAFLADHPEHADIKATDAVGALRELDALTPASDPRWAGWPWREGWRSRHLRSWQAEFGGREVEGRHVGVGQVARYRQIYWDPTPRAWRRHVLARIGGLPVHSSADHLLVAATGAAARHGVTTASLTVEQRQQWLTSIENGLLTDRQELLTVLVRSYRPARGPLPELVEALDVWSDEADWRAVAQCHAVNDEVASWGPGHRPEQLRDDTLREHLAQTWATEPGDRLLLAAARDRGFNSVKEAVLAVRPFFLRHYFNTLEPAAG